MLTKKTSRGRRRVRTGPVSSAEAKERQELILKIAAEEFLSKGFRGATLQVIAKRCRIGKMTLYGIFKSKEALFSHIAATSIPKFRYDLLQALRTDRTFKDVIRNVVELMIDSTKDRTANSILRLAVSERDQFPALARMTLNHSFELVRPLGGYLRAMAHKDALTDDQALRLAYHLMSMANGGFGCLLAGPETLYADREAWVSSVTQLFVEPFPLAGD